jgi:hypothetical protein
MYGMGKRQALQSAADAMTTAWLSYALRLIYQVVLGTTKLGICMFYLRVFRDRTSQIFVYSMIGFICLFTVPLEIYVAVGCRHVDPSVSNGLTCVHNTPDLYLFAICSIVSDILLVIFVVPRVRELAGPSYIYPQESVNTSSSPSSTGVETEDCVTSRALPGPACYYSSNRSPYRGGTVQRWSRPHM